MILVTVKRKDRQSDIQSIEISGHAESGPYGYDLVCAGVSAVSIGSVNAVMELSNTDLEIDQEGEGGYLKIEITGTRDPNEMEKAQILLEGMLVSLKSIEMGYGKYIKIIEN